MLQVKLKRRQTISENSISMASFLSMYGVKEEVPKELVSLGLLNSWCYFT